MAAALFIGFACLFFIMGHGTLLYFRMKEADVIPAKDLVLPWPKNGKFVSYLCISLSALCLGTLSLIPFDFNLRLSQVRELFVVTTLAPLAWYGLYIWRRLHNESGTIVFRSVDTVYWEWAIPLGAVAVASLLSHVIHW